MTDGIAPSPPLRSFPVLAYGWPAVLAANGTQWRLVLWVVRATLGCNRASAPFGWSQIAKNLKLDRAGVCRNGRRLRTSGLLRVPDGNYARNAADSTLLGVQV